MEDILLMAGTTCQALRTFHVSYSSSFNPKNNPNPKRYILLFSPFY